MEILWEFSKKIGIFWHICGKNIEKIGLGKLKINRKSLKAVFKLCNQSFYVYPHMSACLLVCLSVEKMWKKF